MPEAARLPLFSPLIEQAIEVSSQWHDVTYRKGRFRDPAFDVPEDQALRVPVMAHLTNVALLVQRAGWDDIAVAAAFLHDTIEDANRWGDELRFGELRTLMGDDVANCVLAVSEPKRLPDGRHMPWKLRKDAYLESLRAGDARSIAVSLADKLHNLWSINQALAGGIDVFSNGNQRRTLSAGPEKQRWFFTSVRDLSLVWEDPRLERLRDELSLEIDRFVRLTGI